DYNTVVVPSYHVAWVNGGVGTINRNIDRTHSCFDGAACVNGSGKDGKLHLLQFGGIAHPAVNHQSGPTASAEGCCQKFAKETRIGFGGAPGNDDISVLQLFGGDVQHPVITGLQQYGHRRSAECSTVVDRAHIGSHQA